MYLYHKFFDCIMSDCNTCFHNDIILYWLESYIPLNTITIKCCPKYLSNGKKFGISYLLELGEFVDAMIEDIYIGSYIYCVSIEYL